MCAPTDRIGERTHAGVAYEDELIEGFPAWRAANDLQLCLQNDARCNCLSGSEIADDLPQGYCDALDMRSPVRDWWDSQKRA